MNDLSFFKAILLGLVQGATEFIPVSSSGHLVLAQTLLNVKLEGAGLLAFDICLHFGTLVAVTAVFWRDILFILRSLIPSPLRGEGKGEGDQIGKRFAGGFIKDARDARRMAALVIIGTIPAVIIAFLFKDFFEELVRDATSAAFMFFITGVILWLTRFSKVKEGAALTLVKTIAIGVMQAIAIVPGISRSGSTISAGLFTGLPRELAARFSFLLSIPAIAGAMVLGIGDLKALSSDILVAVIAGTAVAAVVGYISIRWLLKVVISGRFSLFSYYCFAVGAAALIYKYFL